ncbi:MAG: DUF6544 family protein [Pseudomonadota bacterium]
MLAFKVLAIGVGLLGLGLAAAVAVGSIRTERDIAAFQDQVSAIALERHARQVDPAALATLPVPVQRYVAYTFPDGISSARVVRVAAEGQFRRPQTEGFSFTISEQVIAITEPALMFSATTPIIPGVWARAYDFFADGEMEMKAKILSLMTVVDEAETPELNRISLRRWLLESALYPHALLPGGPVRWEAIDDTSARAVVEADGLAAKMVAHFDAAGRMTHMIAEEDGDLATPYHGSGEHVLRSDYRDVGGVMIPHAFVISRASQGEIFPFFDAVLTDISFE